MTDTAKVKLIKQIIEDFYGYTGEETVPGYVSLVSAIDTILNFEEGKQDE